MNPLPHNLHRHLIGGGLVGVQPDGTFRLTLPPTPRGYADAQVDDYRGLPRVGFPWTPPVTLAVRARASAAAPLGTLGFGFWNDPLGLSLGAAGGMRRLPATPQAAWFFYGSEPNDFSFVPGGPGSGWKAAVLRSPSVPSLILAPGAAGALLLGLMPGLRRVVVRLIQRVARAAEARVELPLESWHEYRLTWGIEGVTFVVDGEMILNTPIRPRPPLGFVGWIDNQYAVLTESRGLRFGVLPTDREMWLELSDLRLEGG